MSSEENAKYISLMNTTVHAYISAIKKAKTIGGKKFHNKQYGGGIVFQSYNIAETAKQIHELINA